MFYRSTILTTENAGDLQQMLDIVVIESGKKGHYYLKKKKKNRNSGCQGSCLVFGKGVWYWMSLLRITSHDSGVWCGLMGSMTTFTSTSWISHSSVAGSIHWHVCLNKQIAFCGSFTTVCRCAIKKIMAFYWTYSFPGMSQPAYKGWVYCYVLKTNLT